MKQLGLTVWKAKRFENEVNNLQTFSFQDRPAHFENFSNSEPNWLMRGKTFKKRIWFCIFSFARSNFFPFLCFQKIDIDFLFWAHLWCWMDRQTLWPINLPQPDSPETCCPQFSGAATIQQITMEVPCSSCCSRSLFRYVVPFAKELEWKWATRQADLAGVHVKQHSRESWTSIFPLVTGLWHTWPSEDKTVTNSLWLSGYFVPPS